MKIALILAIMIAVLIFRKKIVGMFKTMKEGKKENSTQEA
jgi:hypothetical protein